MKYTIICALVAAAAAAGARGNTYFAPNAGPECFMHNKRTVVHFTTKFHPSFTCSHNAALTKCSCVSLHPTHHHGKCQEIFHTDGSQHTLGGDCSASGKNPEYTQWSAWSTCTKTCGGGSTTRTRTCNHATSVCQAAGLGDATQTQSCKTQGCPVHCALSAWSSFGACSANCGGGTQTRTKSVVTQPANGGNTCGNKSESRSCNTQSCGKQDCQSWRDAGKTASGTYHLCPGAGVCFDAYCRMDGHKGYTLVATRGGKKNTGNPRPHVQNSRLTPESKSGGALSTTRFAPLLAVSTNFYFRTSNGDGHGAISRLTGGNSCRNLGTDLTKCNLVHTESHGCAYHGGDYCSIMGVAAYNHPAYPDDCNYFRNVGCPRAPWTSGSASGSFYATWSDLYVTRPGTTPKPPASCQEQRNAGKTASGTYTICPGNNCFQAYCRMEGTKGFTLVASRGGKKNTGSARPHVQNSVLAPESKSGGALSKDRFAPLLAISSSFMFRTNQGNGYGAISRLTGGNSCRNLSTDLTKCNLVHTESHGCAYHGGDYCSIMGVAAYNHPAYPDDCNYFRNVGCPRAPWTSGSASGSFYATWSDLYVQ